MVRRSLHEIEPRRHPRTGGGARLAALLRYGLIACSGGLLLAAAVVITHRAAIGSSPPEGQPPAIGTRSSDQPTRVAAVQPTVQPRFVSETEAELRAALRSFVAPLLAHRLADEEAGHLRTAVAAAQRGDLSEWGAARSTLVHPVAARIADWAKLRAGVGSLSEYRAFIEANTDWPDRDRLIARMEAAAFTAGATVGEIKALFEAFPPQTGLGLAALASAHLAAGDVATARPLAARAWRENNVPANLETGFVARFSSVLDSADHLARVDRIMADPTLRKATRDARAEAVRRVIPLMTEADQRQATAALSLYLGQSAADRFLAALTDDQRAADGIQRQLAFRDLRNKRFKTAAQYLSRAKSGQDSGAADSDWRLREAVARALVGTGDAAAAFAVVSGARPDDANLRKDQAFYSGDIALRLMRNPEQAIPHFERYVADADGPLSASRAQFWLGQAHKAAGRNAEAEAAFALGGTFLDTFHGALSRVQRAPPQRHLTLPFPDLPTDAEVARLLARDVVLAGVLADRAGLDRAIVRALFGAVTWRDASAGEVLLIAELAEALGDTQIAVRAGKAGVARGFPHYLYSYPVHKLPEFEPLGRFDVPPPELLLAIARQESEFNTTIVSRAGARGVLQVMPIAARHVCQVHQITCEIERLLTDESYNAKIAAAYIGEQMAAVRGNMILTLTSYNAGPGRTRQWLRQRGDPRAPDAAPLDWVYAIPFEETRLYVQKVLSNLQVYRARLGRSEDANQIDRELGLTK